MENCPQPSNHFPNEFGIVRYDAHFDGFDCDYYMSMRWQNRTLQTNRCYQCNFVHVLNSLQCHLSNIQEAVSSVLVC